MPIRSSPDPDTAGSSPGRARPRAAKAAAAILVCAGIVLIAVALLGPAETSNRAGPPITGGQPAAPGASTGRQGGGRVFYVAPGGEDANSGMSPAAAWRTVMRVNRAELDPGDTVLFQGGATFNDRPLMPGRGDRVSGTARAPVTFGSWGHGRAVLPQGIWLGTSDEHPHGPSHLNFTNLALGPDGGFQGTGDYISIRGLRISGLVAPHGRTGVGIETRGSHWVIANNVIDRTGDSGMLLGFDAQMPGDPPGGSDYMVTGNSIAHTGLDRSLGYAAHGIYVKVTDATIEHNHISYFATDGVSARYRNARIIRNDLDHGAIGIAWFQYDKTPGTSKFIANKITDTTNRAIFVCGVSAACVQPIESFVVSGNQLRDTAGTLLQPTTGRYDVSSSRGG